MMQAVADVVIIGAGVIGCSTAYHLARMGITNVVVLEKEQVGSGTSGKSASMLGMQFCHDELSIDLVKQSYARYMQFEQELGVSIDFKPIGWLTLATAQNAEQLRSNAQLLQSLGVRTLVLEPDEIKRRYPEINTQDLALGALGPDDGPVDPHMIMWGYIKKACEMGVRLCERVRATGLSVQSGQVTGVNTDQGFVATRMVVNAAGPWAIEVGRWAGVEVPIVNLARSILVTRPLPDIPSTRPFVDDLTAEWYYRPEGPGVLMGMGTLPVEDMEVSFSPEIVDEMIETAVHRVPVLEKASMLTGWAGIRPMSPDDRPILGPAPSIEGLVLNCGWGGAGIMQAPIGGQLVAEYISQGRATTMDISVLGVERFSPVR